MIQCIRSSGSVLSLCDLVILEQLKNIIPERIVTYINEQKVKTAARAWRS